MRRLCLTTLTTLLLAGCVPNLGGWRVDPPDGGNVARRDGGGLSSDAGPELPVPDCSSPIPLGAGYREGFEGGPGGWGVLSENEMLLPSWEWGRPAGEQITRAGEGENAWATGLAMPYTDREQALLVSPCFDASDTTHDLLLSVNVAAYTEGTIDRVALEYSVDGGEWLVATGEDRIGWYAGGGWGGERDWQEGSALLPGTAGASRVQLRFRFRSDGSVIGGDGVAIDDVFLRPASFDLAVSVAPAARCGWLIATVTNVGGVPVTGFEIRSNVDGAPSSAPYDRELRYLDTETLEVGGPLASTTTASVFTVGDEDASNDSVSMGHPTTPFGSGYFSDFEADDGGLELRGEPTSWQWGTPNDALIRSAGSGSRAWMTNLTEDYGRSERGYLLFPCYDMSAQTRDPQVSLQRVFDTEACCDRGRVEMSVDGADFQTVGSTSSGGVNWYTSSQGWSGSSGAGLWALAQHPLEGAAGHRAVRVRIYFHSDGSGFGEGFGIDDLALTP